MLSKPACLLFCAALLAGTFSGCGETPIRRAAVHGSVTFNDEPIEDGSIVFVPIKETRGQPVGATITGGEYSLDALNGPAIGPNKVEFYANRKTGKTVKGAFPAPASIEQVTQIIPKEFNKDSETMFEVADGENEFDYDVKGK